MTLCDVNILVYAYRDDSLEHQFYREWLSEFLNSHTSFAISDVIFSGFLRIATHSKIFKTPSSFEQAKEFVDVLRSHPGAVPILPNENHWEIFIKLCRKIEAGGNLIPDAYIAALAMGSGCSLATADRDFKRFKGLKVVYPKGL